MRSGLPGGGWLRVSPRILSEYDNKCTDRLYSNPVGLGSTVYVGEKWGFYTNVSWYLPAGYSREASGTRDSGYFEKFRFGNNLIIGAGWFPLKSEKAGLILGGGLHTDFAYFNRYPSLSDPNITFFELCSGRGYTGITMSVKMSHFILD